MKNVNDIFPVFSHPSPVNLEEEAVRVTPPCSVLAQCTIHMNHYGSFEKTVKLANYKRSTYIPQYADLGFGEEHTISKSPTLMEI